MKKSCLLILLLVLMNFPLYGGIPYAGGTGTPGDPYIINQLSNLEHLSLTPGDWDKHFKQSADIDASATSTWNSGAGWSPIGYSGSEFTGSYDGDGHNIGNLYISRSSTDHIGFFGYTIGANISNLGLVNVNITGQSYVGGLVGYNSGSTVSNSYVDGSVNGISYVGGLAGYSTSSASISSCYAAVNVSGTSHYVGGLVGYNSGSTVSNSYANGSVTRSSGSALTYGGFAGYSFMSTIEYCYASGKVYQSPGTIWSTGDKGFIGDVYYDTFTQNFFDSEASEQTSGIGATAKTSTEMKDHTTFTGAGWDFTDIWAPANAIDGLNNYPKLQWESTNAPAAEPAKVGDVYQISSLDDLRWIVENPTHWDKQYQQTANIDASASSAWDDGAGWTAIGNISIKFTGSYDGDDHSIGNLFIDRPVGDDQGLFGYIFNSTITNLTLNNVDITARYRVGGLAARPDNSTIENCSSSGSLYSTGDATSTAGGLVGATYQAVIRNSHSSVNVTAEKARAGGLAGQIWGSSDIKTIIDKCYASGNVQGSTYIGGLIGLSDYGTIQNCYAIGDVTRIAGSGETGFAAFLGHENFSPARSTIDKCYAIGNIYYTDAENPTDKGFAGRAVSNAATVYTNNFFDSEAANQSTAIGATARTTVEMKNNTTYISAGWDFTGESGNGNDDIWDIDPEVNDGYPYLTSNMPVPDVPLPITLTSFSAAALNGSVSVTWVTESESENAHFLLYRDGEVIAQIPAAGTSSEPHSYAYTDRYVVPGRTYTYQLADVSFDGEEVKHNELEVEVEGEYVDRDYTIGAAYPNPFNPLTVVPLNLAKEAVVTATLYDISGRPLRELQNGTLAAGSHAITIDGANLSTGIYFVRVRVNNATHVQKIALMK